MRSSPQSCNVDGSDRSVKLFRLRPKGQCSTMKNALALRMVLWIGVSKRVFHRVCEGKGGSFFLLVITYHLLPTSPEWLFSVLFPRMEKKRRRDLTSAIHWPKFKIKLRKYKKVRLDLTFCFPPCFFRPEGKKTEKSFLTTYFWSPPSHLYVIPIKQKTIPLWWGAVSRFDG